MTKYNDLEDVTISNVKVGDVVKYTADGWKNAPQVEVKPPDGNVCGEGGGGFNPDAPQTLTDKWTWEDAGCPAIVVTDTVGSNIGDSAEICSNKFVVRSENGQYGEFKTRSTDGVVELRGFNSELKFRDNKVTTPVSLSDLLGSSGGGSGSSDTFNPIIVNFALDQGNSQITNQSFRTVNAYQAVEFGYGMGWTTSLFPNFPHRAYDVLKSFDVKVTMPDGANGAILAYEGRTQFGVHNTNDLSAQESYRTLHCAHRVDVDNVKFPIGYDQAAATGTTGDYKKSFGQNTKGVIVLPNNGETNVNTFKATDSFTTLDLITFNNQQEVTFRARVDILKGGRGTFKTKLGRLVIYPFYSEDPENFYWIGPELGDPANISGFNLPSDTYTDGSGGFSFTATDDDDYQRKLDALYNYDSPPETPAETAFNDGLEYRNLLSRIRNALESRKNYPPNGGATFQEYEDRIKESWDLAESTNLATSEEFLGAFEVYYTEIVKEKYGIAFLFEFEKNAGITNSRGAL